MRKTLAAAAAVVLALSLTGCNYKLVDTTYTFTYAYVELPNGEVVEGEVSAWRDYDGDQLQVTINGVTYLSNSTRIVMTTGG
jgi:ABC-type glycerol-3-phosphate transport system substrate-binding protein